MHIGILGAGIVGVNTALEAQLAFPNAQITLLAQKFDEDTLSNGAAGIFRPGTNFNGPTPHITKRWIDDSYHFYNDILCSEEAHRAGVFKISGYIFSSEHKSVTKNHYLEELLPLYRSATEEELKICPGSWKYGAFFTTMIIESGDFLPWARSRFEKNGGKVRSMYVEKLSDLGEINNFDGRGSFDAVFNCTGFGSKWLCNDTKLVPVRGQVIKVRANWMKTFFYGDYDTYVIPGRRYVTLGGCRQLDSYNENIDKYDSSSIWDRCTTLVPSLLKAERVKEWAGLRPYRDMVRCEAEEIQIGTKYLKIIHDYGHGGYGVTTAPGTAKYSVHLLKELLRGSGRYSSTSSTCYKQISKL